MLEVEQLAVRYNEVPAVHHVSFSVPAGEIVALLGSNGSGKSSILRAIAGLTAASSGRIVFDSRDITREPAHLRAAIGLTLVPEGRRLFPKLSVEKNLRLGAYARRDLEEIERALGLVFALFPVLKERRLQMAGTLSGGEQQMLAIGRGLTAKPKLLMLDEPSWGLAPKLVTKIIDTIQAINASGVTILLVEQSVHRALAIAHRAYVIQTGRIVLEGTGRELLGNASLQKAYLGI
ncbi:MAG TPA: ABC transporter ATP-binding protein [Myxococcaceae bacterium]|nr:ABC transporter ATP-binding protein [Myxococcaceae bacterium]